jgi:hypothetical protein
MSEAPVDDPHAHPPSRPTPKEVMKLPALAKQEHPALGGWAAQ